MKESFATVLETIADARAQRVAVSHGDVDRTWAELDERASRLAGFLTAAGVGHDDRVAIGLYNGVEYIEVVFAILKVRAVPVNVNYRYRREELVGLLSDSGAVAIVYDSSMADRLGEARADLPRLTTAVQVGSEVEVPGWATAWDDALRTDPAPRIERGDDGWVMYTGGTTGRPKGVWAPHSWLFRTVCSNGYLLLGEPVPESLDELRDALHRIGLDRDSMVCLPAPPLMHGTGMYTSLGALVSGGRVVYLASRRYDPDELAATIARQQVTVVSVVGDVFARPLADALDRAEAEGRPYDLSSLTRMLSVGVTWSADVKQRLLHHADIVIRDSVAASEGGPFAIAETRRGDEVVTARFRLAPGARIVDEEGRDVVPGSGQVGMLAAPAVDGIGYAGDDAATAAVFKHFDGRRWVVPGDMASLDADGTVVFQGRGSRVINTGGEKVFAEEVEQVLLTHPAVRDAMVVGTPDERWGSRIVAVVSLHPGATLTTEEAREFVGERLADHKRPRDLVISEQLQRSPSGKADLAWAKLVATGSPDPSTDRQQPPLVATDQEVR
ncbi:AMP-binding protein [Modestobacter versicolor]|uniref:Acyl-CoA synthetase n=1 Tax=Modestobacter versicolor TaxID=429133 RepID=A0A323VMV3_9ACTN|nr:AMP-binding protein [Modestobacter versicolor]MBB3674282.1 fatty-acyl-CoA synthase [Modestobacter versicolor]PZA20968.1 acyl-CoA synthetase [Modestobacter versicolor]